MLSSLPLLREAISASAQEVVLPRVLLVVCAILLINLGVLVLIVCLRGRSSHDAKDRREDVDGQRLLAAAISPLVLCRFTRTVLT